MKSLLIVAHGSRKNTSNDEVKLLKDRIVTSLKPEYTSVKIAFLEFASPSIEEAINDLFHDGTSELVVLPYFLSAGKHVTNDLPVAIDAVVQHWSNKSIHLLPHIGAMDVMVDMIISACDSQAGA